MDRIEWSERPAVKSPLVVCAFKVWHGTGLPDQLAMGPRLQSDILGKEAMALPLFITLRAFAAGCTALTGIEAVSDGVQSFRDPAAKNARIVSAPTPRLRPK